MSGTLARFKENAEKSVHRRHIAREQYDAICNRFDDHYQRLGKPEERMWPASLVALEIEKGKKREIYFKLCLEM